ncbi:MAG TPA: hypothetical protein VJT83_02280 [Chitinophagaceae bacterium]|nr:hypothetical protein [Chitinophagaceae bacterium]
MRKFLILFISLVAANFAKSQTSGAVVTTIPSSFTAEDQVKIIIDVSNVPNLKDKEPLYMWTWEPGDAAPGNGSWENSNEARKLTKEGPNKWSITLTPSTFYGKAPAEVKQISFLVKAKNGNGDAKTDDIHLSVAPLIFVPSAFRTFPKIVGQNEFITFYLDQSLATDIVTQRMTPTQAKISLWSTAGAQVDVEKTVNVSKTGNLYWYAFLPSKLFTIPNGVTIAKMRVIFKGKGKDANGNDIDVESPAYEYGFDDLK